MPHPIFHLLLALVSQDPKIDQKKVDAAVEKGAAFLLDKAKKGVGPDQHTFGPISREELVVYTLLHAGVDPANPAFQAIVTRMQTKELAHTYSVSLMAMALAALDRRKHQPRIAQCAQFLVDNQCTNGQWSYGKSVRLPTITPGAKPAAKAGSTEALPLINIPKRGSGPASGDNSNSQYAALGLRACWEAGIRFPVQVMGDAEKWWEKSQHKDGGWGYDMSGFGTDGKESYASMTAGAVGALVIWKHYQKKDYEKVPSVTGGLKWLGDHFSVTDNPGVGGTMISMGNNRMWHYYWLYALERAGMLYGTEEIGRHEWYPEGVKFLLDAQASDGSWSGKNGNAILQMDGGGTVADTCFAILFLRRATKPVRDVASVDPAKK